MFYFERSCNFKFGAGLAQGGDIHDITVGSYMSELVVMCS